VGKRESGKERERERKWGVENERKRVGEIERERKPSYQNLKRKKAVFSNNKILIVCLEREREKERKRECRVRNEEERNILNQSAKHSRREYTTRTTIKPRRAASHNKVVRAHRSFSHIYKN